MKKLLLLKVILKNITRFHLRYIYLLKKNKVYAEQEKVIKNNIFIITSCINIHDNIAYPVHNSSHTATERLSEALIGLKSVRNNYADAYIIFLESSKILDEDRKKVECLVDEYHDYSGYKSIKLARKHYNKGVPQFTALINFLEENSVNYNADTFHFLGARYSLTDNITNNINRPAGAYFLHYPEDNNVSTRYFFVNKLTLREIINPFRKTLYCAIAGASVEDFISCFFKDNFHLNKLGVMGRINGKVMIRE